MLARVKAVSVATPAAATFVAVSVATGWIGGPASSRHGSFGSGLPAGVGAGSAGDVEGNAIAEICGEDGVGLGSVGGPDDQNGHGDEDGRKEHETMGFHEGWGTALDQLVALYGKK